MKHFPISGSLPLIAMVALSACVDNQYDLDDIDTTTEIKIKDLVIPVNMDAITLGDIIEIEDDSELKEVTINGQTFYAVDKTGSFESKDIHIPGFSVTAPHVESNTIHFQNPLNGMNVPAGTIVQDIEIPDIHYPIEGQEPAATTLDYEAHDIDESIVSLETINTAPFSVILNFSGAGFYRFADMTLENVEITLPKGIRFKSLSPAGTKFNDGILTIPSLVFDGQGKAKVELVADGIDNLPANGYAIDILRNLSIHKKVSIDKAVLKVKAKSSASLTDLKNAVYDIDVAYDFGDITAQSVLGTIKYYVEGINIDPIELNDLPDFLDQDETNLVLANPQIYLNVNNPVGSYGLSYQSGISLTPYRNGIAQIPNPADNGFFKVDPTDKRVNLCLSPTKPTNVPGDFATDLKHFSFQALSNVIAGDGLPERIDIDLIDPMIPQTEMTVPFPLGSDLPKVEGNWQFLAPLALKANSGSKIIYTDRNEDLFGSDLEDLTISTLSISMTVESDMPLNITLDGKPLDSKGNAIQEAKVTPITIKGLEGGSPVPHEAMLEITGPFNDLCGFEFTASVTSASDEALSPNQKIKLTNLRAKVSGKYVKDF